MVLRIANNLSGSGGGLPSTPKKNAFRHTLWSANLSQATGVKTAKNAGDAREGLAGNYSIDLTQPFALRGELGMGVADHIVDLLNNDIGRGIGQNAGGNLSANELARKVLEEQFNNGLYVAKEAADGTINIYKEKITKDEYDTAIKNLQSMDENGMTEDQVKAK